MSVPRPVPAVVFWLVPPVVGSLCTMGALALALFAAGTVGTIYSIRQKRNLIPGSLQIASYLMGYLLFWAIFGAASGFAMIEADNVRWFNTLAQTTGIHRDILVTLSWLFPNLVCLVGYFALVARGTSAARYANR